MPRTVLVTGSNGALGAAIARAFLEGDAEASLWLGVRSNRDRAEALAAEFPGRARTVELDVSKAADWERAVGGLLEADGRIDVLVNNAGAHDDALLATMPDAVWESVRASNLDGTFYGCRAVARAMLAQRGGRIVNVASLSALSPPAGQTNYAAAKAGVVALTQSLAKELARAGVTVNAVCPGYIDTEALADMGGEAREAAQRRVPMRRFGRPGEVAAAVRFLACPEASYITGSVLKIDGGLF